MVGKLPDLKTARFRYIGPEPVCEVYGVVFKRGEAVDVNNQTYLGAHALKKLSGNRHFEEVTDDESGASAPGTKKRKGSAE